MKKLVLSLFSLSALLFNNQLPKQKFKGFSFIVPSLLIAFSGLQRHCYLHICKLGLKVMRPRKRFFLLNAERSDKKSFFDTVHSMLRGVSLPHLLTDLEQRQLTFETIARTGAHIVGRLSPPCLNDTYYKSFENQLTDLEQRQLTFETIARTGAHTVGRLFFGFIQIFKNLVGGLEGKALPLLLNKPVLQRFSFTTHTVGRLSL